MIYPELSAHILGKISHRLEFNISESFPQSSRSPLWSILRSPSLTSGILDHSPISSTTYSLGLRPRAGRAQFHSWTQHTVRYAKYPVSISFSFIPTFNTLITRPAGQFSIPRFFYSIFLLIFFQTNNVPVIVPRLMQLTRKIVTRG